MKGYIGTGGKPISPESVIPKNSFFLPLAYKNSFDPIPGTIKNAIRHLFDEIFPSEYDPLMKHETFSVGVSTVGYGVETIPVIRYYYFPKENDDVTSFEPSFLERIFSSNK